jgi:hypothetical protein
MLFATTFSGTRAFYQLPDGTLATREEYLQVLWKLYQRLAFDRALATLKAGKGVRA